MTDQTDPTLVLIPGLLSDARVWHPVAQAAPQHRVYAADVTKDPTIQDMAARILAETSGDLIVVGHSMGARVAMELTDQAPTRVRGLVLANTGHHPLKPGEVEKREAKIAQGHADFPGMVRDWLPPMVAASRHSDTALMQDLTQMALSVGPKIHERQIRALVARPNASAVLPRITCPVLLLAGTEDIWSPPAQHQEMAAMLARPDLHIIDGAGHFLPVEQPELAAALITTWRERLL